MGCRTGRYAPAVGTAGWRASGRWWSARGSAADPFGERKPDLAGGVFLDEMDAGNGDLALVGPGSAELSLRPGQGSPRVRVDEQLRNHVLGHPAAVTGDDRGHIG